MPIKSRRTETSGKVMVLLPTAFHIAACFVICLTNNSLMVARSDGNFVLKDVQHKRAALATPTAHRCKYKQIQIYLYIYITVIVIIIILIIIIEMIRREFPRGAISDGSSFCVTTAVFAWAIDRWLNEGSPFRHLSTNGHSGGHHHQFI